MKTFFGMTSFALILAVVGLAPAADDCKWTVLFDGTDLSTWDNGTGGAPGAGWVIEDGVVTRKEPAGYIWTKEKYGDFVLELEFKTEGNSGLFFRTGNPRDCVQTGLEMQIYTPIDTPNKHSVGSIYDAVAPNKNAAVEGWNKVVLTAKGSRIIIEMNGEKIIDADLDQWTEVGKNPDGSPNKYRTAIKDFPREGHVGLQEHGDVVSFRNIRIRPL